MMLGMKTHTSLCQIFKVYIAEPVLITLGFHQWLWGGTGTPREGHILCTSLWGGNALSSKGRNFLPVPPRGAVCDWILMSDC